MGHAGWIHKRRSQSVTNALSPISFPLNQLRPYSRVQRCRTGKSEVDGSAPLSFCPVRARGCCAIYICATPPGRAPIDIISGGKAPEKNPEDLLWLCQASVPDTWCMIPV